MQQSLRSRSGIMLGLGEQEDEVIQTLKDLRSVDVDIVTIGQYLQPSFCSKGALRPMHQWYFH